jgi:hypothetical protein
MSQTCSGGFDGGATRRNAAALRAADGLALAAAPTFAIMALLTGVLGGGPAEMLCSGAHVSPLSGMVTMYLLMSAFHAAPWLKLIRAGVLEGKLHTLHGTASAEAGKPCSEEPNEDGHPRRTHYIT